MQKYAMLYEQRRGLNSALPQAKVEMTPQHIYILSMTPLLEGFWWGGWDSNPLTQRERIYSPPRLSNFAASPYLIGSPGGT